MERVFLDHLDLDYQPLKTLMYVFFLHKQAEGRRWSYFSMHWPKKTRIPGQKHWEHLSVLKAQEEKKEIGENNEDSESFSGDL